MKQDLNNTGIPSTSPPFNAELAFPYLTDEMVTRLHGYGHKEAFDAETALWTRGEREVDMFVVLEGTVEVYALGENGERKVVATLHEKQFSGELDLLSSRQTLVDGCTVTACILLRVPSIAVAAPAAFRRRHRESNNAGDHLAKAWYS